MGKIHVFFVRHGESIDDVARGHAGPPDAPLTSHGVIQSNRLGKHLAGRIGDIGPITHIFSSDFQQAQKTAEAIRDASLTLASGAMSAVTLEIIQLAELREKEFNVRDKESSKSTTARDGELQTEPEMLESGNTRAKRFLNAVLIPLLEDLLRSDKLQSVVVVAHGGIHSHVWLQFIFMLRNLGIGLISTSGYMQVESVPLDEFLTNACYHELVMESPTVSANASTSRPEDNKGNSQIFSGVQVRLGALNYDEHLQGLRKTGGGIGNAKFDGKQRTIDSFFGSKS